MSIRCLLDKVTGIACCVVGLGLEGVRGKTGG